MKYKAFSSPGFLYESFSVLIFSFLFAFFSFWELFILRMRIPFLFSHSEKPMGTVFSGSPSPLASFSNFSVQGSKSDAQLSGRFFFPLGGVSISGNSLTNSSLFQFF